MKNYKLEPGETLKINLQLFAGEGDDTDDNQEDAVDLPEGDEIDEIFDDLEDDSELDESEDDEAEKPGAADLDKSKQSPENNAQFKKMRLKAEQEIKNELAAERAKLDADKKEIESFRQQQQMNQIENKYLGEVTEAAIEKLAYDENITEEFAKKHLLNEAKSKAALEINTYQVRASQYQTQKETLRSKPYFKELEKDIDTMISQNNSIDVNTAYNYLRGVKLDELIANTKSNAEKRTLANVQDSSKRRSVPSGASGNAGLDVGKILSKDDIEMAIAFGNDPRTIAKKVREHNQNKKRS